MWTSAIDRKKAKKMGRGYQNRSQHFGDPIKRLVKRNLHGYLELNLRGRNLISVPSEVFGYAAIQKLVLSNNELEHLHPAISMLKCLQCLQLEQNKLSSLPPEIHQCQQLRYFDMSSNRLTTVPTVLLTLRRLKILSLANNMLQHLPRNFGCLGHLKILNLGGNRLKNLPNSAQNLNKLKELDLSHNLFEQIPPAMCLMAQLKIFNMSGNSLTFVTPCLDNLKKLQEMNFSHNLLETVFMSTSKLKNVRYLNLSYNHLVTVPTFLLQLPHLKILHLQGNRITDFPDGFASLIHLNLANNYVNEFSVHKMKSLQSLNVNRNLLKNVPHGLCCLKKLEHFSANNNQIGNIPQGMKDLKRLRTLDIGNNRITHQPQWIRELTNLEYFNIKGNNLKQQHYTSLTPNPSQNKTVTIPSYQQQHFIERQAIRGKNTEEPKHCHPQSKSLSSPDNNQGERKSHPSKERLVKKYQKQNAQSSLQTVQDSKPKVVFQSNNDVYTTWNLSPADSRSTWVYPVKNTYITYNYALSESESPMHNTEDISPGPDIKASYFSDITYSSEDGRAESLTSDGSSVDSEHSFTDLYQCSESNDNNICVIAYPKLMFQDEMYNCCCPKHSYRKMAKELVKIIKETFSISCKGGSFVSSLNPNICLYIPSYNLDHPLQLIMKVVHISEEAVNVAQQRDPSLSNVLSLSVAVMLTPNTDVPFEAPLHISLPAPRTVDENASGCLHVLTAKDDNSCTPFFRKYSLKNGCISLKTYHLSGKVAVITKSKCHYKACKSTETLLMQFLH